ncbi:RNA-directed DNA polymerase from mobile element jockey [Trichonephila clavipes]|uniref:RNA-directed DNA polymerase from mobile element jockey n=1 Tax=Trichonephila clavipes TaxID=2585209 RepID=A0A8X6RWM1_TRICX|nr:RNA-directed DNA polymerase from mobile element jockey [Trichonephila clavipes]
MDVCLLQNYVSRATISKVRDNPRSTELNSLQFFQVCRRCNLKDLVPIFKDWANQVSFLLCWLFSQYVNPLFNIDFTLPELSYALQNLDTNKSPGPDSIPGHFLSHLGTLGRERLLYICNLSWKTGKLPRQWKSAIVIPIHKPNKNAGLMTSYHPISLTCITCKLMECMVLRRLTHHLHTNNLMPSEQFAFRKVRSTVDQILYFTQCVRDSRNHKPTRHTMASFLDVSKAFDRNYHTHLEEEYANYRKPPDGRPRVTTPNEDRYLAVTAKRNRRSTASDLSRQLSSATGTTVSRQTVYRRLEHIGLYARRPSDVFHLPQLTVACY